MFAQIYVCPTHGETWSVETGEYHDSEHDEVYPFVLCSQCHQTVKPLMHEGKPVMHVLTADEIFWEMWTDPDEYDGRDEDFGDDY